MNEKQYKIIFSGRLVPGVSGRQALDNLLRLSRKPPDDIRTLFSKPGRVLRRNLPLAKAEQILSDLMRAGVVCQIQEMPLDSPEKSPAIPVVATPRILSVVEEGPNVLTLVPITPDSTLTPIDCGFLTAVDGGLETSRLDRSFIAYTDILAATLFASEEGGYDLMLLLFSVGNKRPLIIKGEKIAFSVFPDVPNECLSTSICNFLYFLAAQNPDFCVDEKTDLFMAGVKPDLFCANQLLLACAVFAALSEINEDMDRVPLPAPPPGVAAALSPVTKLVVAQNVDDEDPLECEETAGCNIVRGIDQRAELESWVDRWTWPLISLLLAGLLVPQFKQGLPTDNQPLIWFWELLGVVVGGQQVPLIAIYVFLPLISAVLVLLAQLVMPKRWRGPTLLVAGLVPIALAFPLLQSIGKNDSLVLTPVMLPAGCLVLLLCVSILLVVAVSRLRKQAIAHPQMKSLQRMAGVMLLLLVVLFFVYGSWNNAGLSVVKMIENNAGVVPSVVAIVKSLLIYGGMAMTAGVGLVQILGRLYAGR